MQRNYFGTDGVRGRVGEAPITPELILKLGWAAGRTLAGADGAKRGERPSVLIGKDTRISGYMLESALESGFNSAGGLFVGADGSDPSESSSQRKFW